MVYENKKFRLKKFKTGSVMFEVKKPYLTSQDFTVEEISDMFAKNYEKDRSKIEKANAATLILKIAEMVK